MERGQCAILLFVGALLIYLSIYGVSGLPFGWVNPNLYQDNFNSLDTSFWNPVTYRPTQISDHVSVVVSGSLKATWNQAPQGEELVLVETQPIHDLTAGGSVQVKILQPTSSGKCEYIRLSLGCSSGGYQIDKMQQPAQWRAVYTVPGVATVLASGALTPNLQGSIGLHISSGKISFLVDGSQVYQESYRLPTYTLGAQIVCAASPGYWGTIELDDFELAIGGTTPPPPPGTYNLDVNALYADASNQWQSFTGVTPVVLSGQASKATPATWSLASGMYTVTVPSSYGGYAFKYWSDSVANTNPQRSVTIGSSGVTITACYASGSTPPPPPPSSDILAMVKSFFADPTVRSLMFIVGLACTGIGGIGLVTGRKRRPSYSPAYLPY